MQHESKEPGAPGAEPQPMPHADAAGSGAPATDMSPDQLRAIIGALQSDNDKLRAELEAEKDQSLRLRAEMDNMRKRGERDKVDLMKYAITKFAGDVVGVADNFERALKAVPEETTADNPTLKALHEGVSMTEREFLKVLEKHGVRRIDPSGEAFNPHQHQAVMEQDNPDVPAGTVVQVFQPGYIIEDRVLRPAMVVVARGGQKAAKSTEAPLPANDDLPAGGGEQAAREPQA